MKKSLKKANSNNNLQNQYQSKNNNQVKKSISKEAPPAETDPNGKLGEAADSENNKTLPDQPVYAQGWIKYLHYDDATKANKKMFWKNTSYQQEQNMPDKSPSQSDEVIKILEFRSA